MLLPLGDERFAIIDEADYPRVGIYRWKLIVVGRNEYAYRSDKRDGRWQTVYLHREILVAPAGVEVDHRNHNGLDNRRDNLRLATIAQNQQNRRGARAGSALQLRGVEWNPRNRNYRAYATVARRKLHLGVYATPEEAAAAAAAGRQRLFTHAPENR